MKIFNTYMKKNKSLKKLISTLCFLILFIPKSYLLAQISYGGEPASINYTPIQTKKSKSFDSVYTVADLDMNTVNEELESLNSNNCQDCSNSFYYGKEIEVKIDFFKLAQNIDIKNERKIWLLKIESEKAEGYQLIFSLFRLPKGGELYIYNEDKSMILGSFTSENNRPDGTFLTQYITGNNIYIEYSAPENAEECNLQIDKVVYIYTDIFNSSKGPFSKNGAAKCHINTSCPDGKDLDIEIKSTVMILERVGLGEYWGICSGVLINDGQNYEYNKYPYLLTANHCYEREEGNLSNTYDWIFLFRHEATSCNSDGSDLAKDKTKSALGAQVSARDWGSKSNDYLLLKLLNKVEDISKYDIAFAGYDINKSFVEPGNFMNPLIAIHHPQGDVKKLSISTSPAKSTGWNKEGDDHWEVNFTKGFKTEPASSGSPLFLNKKVIGILHGDNHDITCNDSRVLYKSVYGKLSSSSFFPLGFTSSNPYMPESTNPIKPEPGEDGGNNFSFTIQCLRGGGADARPRVGHDVYIQLSLNNTKLIDGSLRWRLKVNNYPDDFTKYPLWKSNAYITCQEEEGSRMPFHNFKVHQFDHVGVYRVEVEVSTGGNFEKILYNKLVYLSVLNDEEYHTEYFNISHDIYPYNTKKYAPGDKIWIKENINIIDEGYSKIQTPIYSELLSSTPCPYNEKVFTTYYQGIKNFFVFLNKEVIIEETYDATEKYSYLFPLRNYYKPKGYHNILLSKPGMYTMRVLASGGKYTTMIMDDKNCKYLHPNLNSNFEEIRRNDRTSNGRNIIDYNKISYVISSVSIPIIVADCDGKFIGPASELSPYYLSKQRSAIKDIGIGTIEVNSLKLESGGYHMEAYKSIILGPGTHIKEGVNFHAEIVACPSITNTHPPTTIKSVDRYYENSFSGEKGKDIKIYPNPTNGPINLTTSDHNITINSVEIYNINGRLIKNKSSITNPYAFDLSNLANGIYILKIDSSVGIFSYKIIKK